MYQPGLTQFCAIFFALFILQVISSGQKRECFTDPYLQEEIRTNPRRLDILNDIEKHLHDYQKSIQLRNNISVTIPVVVHIVYNTSEENISDQQVLSQIDVLNKDFRRKNADANHLWPQAADTGIDFCLASRDPFGKPTNGITRTYTTKASFSTTDNIVKYKTLGGQDGWPSDKYLNIWVCDISGTVLGFAQFPGGVAMTDGVVIDYKVFGIGPGTTPGFQLGRTTTHEVGHWLNLKHIWGAPDCSTDDLVNDTPKSNAPNYGCNKGHWSCGSIDMVENYMDYSNDACMNLFTAGQRDRMISLFTPGGVRHSITLSDGCQPPISSNAFCGKISVEITLDKYPSETTWDIKSDKGFTVMTGGKYNSAQKNTTIKVDTCLTEGCYTFNIYDTYSDGICCSNGNGKYQVTLDGKMIASGGNFKKSATQTFCVINNKPPTCTDGIKNGSETGVDCGGPTCPVCATCTDGIKNGSETGVDCGGLTCVPCKSNGGNSNIGFIMASYFETGWDDWIGGFVDTERYKGNNSWEGDYSIMIRDDSGDESSMVSKQIDISSFGAVKIEFAFYANSMEKDEDFLLMYFDGIVWKTLKTYVSGKDFFNNHFYEVTVVMDGSNYNFSPKAKFRFQCDASTNADEIYIDAVRISGLPKDARINDRDQVLSVGFQLYQNDDIQACNVKLWPNPASDHIVIDGMEEVHDVYIFDMTGKAVMHRDDLQIDEKMDISDLKLGLYLVTIKTSSYVTSKKLIVR